MKLVKYSYARETFTRLLTTLIRRRPTDSASCEGLPTSKYLARKSLYGYASNICRNLDVDKSYSIRLRPRRGFSTVRTVPDENGKPPSPQEEIISSVVEEDRPLGFDEWGSVRNDVLSARGSITAQSFDAFMVQSCFGDGRFNVGRSFMEFLQQGVGPNVATVGLFMKLFYQCFFSREVDPGVSTFVLGLYDSMRQEWPLLDSTTAERAIQGLSLTSRWKEGLELLDMVKLTDWPRSPTYTALSSAAFNNGEDKLGWQLLTEIFQRVDRKPEQEAYLAWLKNGGSVSILLEFLAEHGDITSVDVVEQLKKSAEGTKMWKGKLSFVTDSGVCRSCNSEMRSANLTNEEYKKLQSAVLERVLIGDNVFLRTTPTELQSFQKFLGRCQKYDIVLDGLNIAMAAINSVNRGSHDCQPALLKDAVQHFRRSGFRVLVLGRKHMGRWSRKHMDYINKNAELFLAENITQDDPLLLLAALNSGLGTKIVTRDLLRSHLHLLKEPDLRRLFRRWQYNHQCTYLLKNGRIRILEPLGLCPEAQKSSENSWHVPYEVSRLPIPASLPLKIPENWLCLVKK